MARRASTKGKLKEWLATANAEGTPTKKPKRKRKPQQPQEEPYDSTELVEQFFKMKEQKGFFVSRKPAVWKNGKRFWSVERFFLLFVVLLSPLGFTFYFFGGLITVPWAYFMWLRAWRNPNYGYRPDGTMKTKLTEM